MHYISHLSKDKKLKKLVEEGEAHELKKRKNICTYLCASIMSQQLSTKVAKVIHNRFLDLYGGKEPTPQQIIDTPFNCVNRFLKGFYLFGSEFFFCPWQIE